MCSPNLSWLLDGVSEMELTPSKFGSVPRGSPMSYHCPPKKSSDLLLHHMAPEFPSLPVMQHTFPRLHFILTLHQLMHLQSLELSPQLSYEIAKETQQQSKCPRGHSYGDQGWLLVVFGMLVVVGRVVHSWSLQLFRWSEAPQSKQLKWSVVY